MPDGRDNGISGYGHWFQIWRSVLLGHDPLGRWLRRKRSESLSMATLEVAGR